MGEMIFQSYKYKGKFTNDQVLTCFLQEEKNILQYLIRYKMYQPQGEGKYRFENIGCEQDGDYVIDKTVRLKALLRLLLPAVNVYI